MPKTIHWYDFPPKVMAAAKRAGLENIPTQIGMRELTGDDHENAMNRALQGVTDKASGQRIGTNFRRRLLLISIAGINFDPERRPEAQKACSEDSGDPNLIPENIYANLHSKALGLVEAAFGDIADGDSEDKESFFKSARTVTLPDKPLK